ncbi:hypothetical protein [Amycolatopsis magusensis]|uniref:hypothetical protein n=1 Tax=Amycolatopsis magusensis TaxID=882444 RepID=UPI00379642C9
MLDAETSASEWRQAHGRAFLTTALRDRAMWWSWKRLEHGLAFEIAFRTDRIRDEFAGQPLIKAALAAVPDPHHGRIITVGHRRRS